MRLFKYHHLHVVIRGLPVSVSRLLELSIVDSSGLWLRSAAFSRPRTFWQRLMELYARFSETLDACFHPHLMYIDNEILEPMLRPNGNFCIHI